MVHQQVRKDVKKDVLFYTFVGIFVSTAVITLLGIINVVEIREGYLNTLVGVLIVELVGAVIAMFRGVDFFSDDGATDGSEKLSQSVASEGPEEQIAATPSTSQLLAEEPNPTAEISVASGDTCKSEASPEEVTPRHPDSSADDYFAELKELEDRYAEREHFLRRLHGTIVTWSAYVQTVQRPQFGKFGVILNSHSGDLDIATVFDLQLPDECRTRAFALRKGDKISFQGKLDTQGLQASVTASTFELETKANSKDGP